MDASKASYSLLNIPPKYWGTTSFTQTSIIEYTSRVGITKITDVEQNEWLKKIALDPIFLLNNSKLWVFGASPSDDLACANCYHAVKTLLSFRSDKNYFKVKIVDSSQLRNNDLTRTHLVIINNLFEHTSSDRLQVVRDAIKQLNTIMLIVVGNPLEFCANKLGVKANGYFYFLDHSLNPEY